MIISKAPVRLSFGGGGTDLPAYYERHGGAVLSVTIDKYFYSILEYNDGGPIEINSSDYQLRQRIEDLDKANLKGALKIPKAVLKHFGVKNGVIITLKSDIPTGSGMGLSGAVSVSLGHLVGSYKQIPLDKKQLAELASHIEIEALRRPIGMQDQYASAFGGLNFITFEKDDIRVERVGISPEILAGFEKRVMLFHTGESRDSARILSGQKKSTEQNDETVLASLHAMKAQAYKMRETLERGDFDAFGAMLREGWEFKKKLAKNISNPDIDRYYKAAMDGGALGGKIAGAGGGGFLMVFCHPEKQEGVRESLTREGLEELHFSFESHGAQLTLDQTGFKSALTPEGYLLGLRAVVSRLDRNQIGRIADMLYRSRLEGKQIFIMGNGGSASTASHFCSDLAKTSLVEGKRGFRVIPLTDNVPLMTAWGNDVGFDDIFHGQLLNLLNEGDVVVGISGGGMSGNVLKAMELARERGARTIGLGGFSGGRLKEMCEECFVVPSNNYQFIEDVHMILVHLLSSILRERIAKEG